MTTESSYFMEQSLIFLQIIQIFIFHDLFLLISLHSPLSGRVAEGRYLCYSAAFRYCHVYIRKSLHSHTGPFVNSYTG